MWRCYYLIEFIDHIAGEGKQGRYKLTKGDGSSENITLELNDDATVEGTPINRENMMAVQGFSNCNTYEDVNELGEKRIIQDYIDRNEKLITTFKTNGEIEEKLVGEKTITKTSSFGVGSNISTEVIS